MKVLFKKKKSLENLLKDFKLIVDKSKILKIFKQKLYYKKPSLKKREKKLQKIKVIQKKIRKLKSNINLY